MRKHRVTPGFTCPKCNVPMGVKRVTDAVEKQYAGRVIYVCVICKDEAVGYFHPPQCPSPANDTGSKTP